MTDRLEDLRSLAEHLTAADQLAERLGFVYETRTFPFRVFRNIVTGMLEDAAQPAPDDDTRRLATPDPIAHPTPDQT